MASENSSQLSRLAHYTKLISQHEAVDISGPSPLFHPSPSYLEGYHATTLSPYGQQYSLSKGRLELLQAIAQLYSPLIGRQIDPQTDLLVSLGSTACVYEILSTFLNPGDEVVLFEPVHPIVTSQIALAGGVAVVVSLSRRSGDALGWLLDMAELRKAFTSKTKLVLINNPNEPCGRAYSLAELQGIAELCKEFDTLCVTDESCDSLVFEGRMERMSSLPGMWDRTLSVHSGGNLFGVENMKLGWVIGHGDFIKEVMKFHVLFLFHTPTPNQVGLTQALQDHLSASEGKGWTCQLHEQAKRAKDKMFSLFTDAGFAPLPSSASPYLLVDASCLGLSEEQCASEELIRRGVGCFPLSLFTSDKAVGNKIVCVSFLQPQSVMDSLSQKLKASLNITSKST